MKRLILIMLSIICMHIYAEDASFVLDEKKLSLKLLRTKLKSIIIDIDLQRIKVMKDEDRWIKMQRFILQSQEKFIKFYDNEKKNLYLLINEEEIPTKIVKDLFVEHEKLKNKALSLFYKKQKEINLWNKDLGYNKIKKIIKRPEKNQIISPISRHKRVQEIKREKVKEKAYTKKENLKITHTDIVAKKEIKKHDLKKDTEKIELVKIKKEKDQANKISKKNVARKYKEKDISYRLIKKSYFVKKRKREPRINEFNNTKLYPISFFVTTKELIEAKVPFNSEKVFKWKVRNNVLCIKYYDTIDLYYSSLRILVYNRLSDNRILKRSKIKFLKREEYIPKIGYVFTGNQIASFYNTIHSIREKLTYGEIFLEKLFSQYRVLVGRRGYYKSNNNKYVILVNNKDRNKKIFLLRCMCSITQSSIPAFNDACINFEVGLNKRSRFFFNAFLDGINKYNKKNFIRTEKTYYPYLLFDIESSLKYAIKGFEIHKKDLVFSNQLKKILKSIESFENGYFTYKGIDEHRTRLKNLLLQRGFYYLFY